VRSKPLLSGDSEMVDWALPKSPFTLDRNLRPSRCPSAGMAEDMSLTLVNNQAALLRITASLSVVSDDDYELALLPAGLSLIVFRLGHSS